MLHGSSLRKMGLYALQLEEMREQADQLEARLTAEAVEQKAQVAEVQAIVFSKEEQLQAIQQQLLVRSEPVGAPAANAI